MARYFLILLICKSITMHAQTMEMISFEKLQERISEAGNTPLILNFWATWCKPCIEELPYFEHAFEKYSESVRIILVNLDFKSQLEKQVQPFIEKHHLRSPIVHLTDPDANSYINKIDSAWSGAIPATVIYKNGEKIFFREGPVTEIELFELIERSIEDTSKNKLH